MAGAGSGNQQGRRPDAIDWVIELTTNTRSAKNELGIPPGAKLAAYLATPSDVAARTIERSSAAIERLARLHPP